MLYSIVASHFSAEVCDATNAAQSATAGNKKLKQINYEYRYR